MQQRRRADREAEDEQELSLCPPPASDAGVGNAKGLSYPAFAKLLGIGIKKQDDDPEDEMRHCRMKGFSFKSKRRAGPGSLGGALCGNNSRIEKQKKIY